MPICRACKQIKEVLEFPQKKIRSDGTIARVTICKICQRVVSKNHYVKNKNSYLEKNKLRKKTLYDYINNYKIGKKCESCGFLGKDNPSSLDFHHIDKKNKKSNVSSLVSYSQKRIDEEISKCVLLCANCHRIRENDERQISNEII